MRPIAFEKSDDDTCHVVALTRDAAHVMECGYLLTLFVNTETERVKCIMCYGFNRKIGIKETDIV